MMYKLLTILGLLSLTITITAKTVQAQQGFSIDYICPDLFEGHIFSCPNIPSVHVGLDVHTDAFVGGAELNCKQNHGGVCISPGIEYGRGNESFDGFEEQYSVLQLKAHGRYSIPVNADSSLTVSPLAGPRFYRFSYTDCPFEYECSESILVLDVGAGIQYKNFGADVFTGINGPNFFLRLKYAFGY